MRISRERLAVLCRERGFTLGRALKDAGVSKNAYYTLARKQSVLPGSIVALADHLGIRPSAFLEEEDSAARKAEALLAKVDGIRRRNRGADRDNVRHTLLLLSMKPVERLRRALVRAQRPDIQ